MKNLNLAYQSLPESVKEWLADENVALFVDEINTKLKIGIENPRSEIIPNLILRLCVQDLEPRDFINELSRWLSVSFESAKTLTREIEERILKPIEAPLKIDVGVDLKLLYFTSAKSGITNKELGIRDKELGIKNEELRKEEVKAIPEAPIESVLIRPAEFKPMSAPITIEKLTESATKYEKNTNIRNDEFSNKPSSIIPEVQKFINLESKPKAESSELGAALAKPFMLHEEKEEIRAASPAFFAKPSFEYRVPISQRPESSKAPSRAQIELARPVASSFQLLASSIKPTVTRVVHYSKFFSRLNVQEPLTRQSATSYQPPVVNGEKGREADSTREAPKIKVPRSRWFM